MKVDIPFLPEFEPLMLSGRKTMTTRTKKYGRVDDHFTAFGAEFEIVGILKLPLAKVALCHFKEEGFDDEWGFVECWKRLHPRKGYQPKQRVYAHAFKKVKP